MPEIFEHWTKNGSYMWICRFMTPALYCRDMEMLSALLAFCGSRHKKPVTWSFGVLSIVSLNKLLNKQSICMWFETLTCSGYLDVRSWANLRSLPLSLQWHHNGRDGVSNLQPQNCLLKRLFRRRSKEASTLRVTGLCEGNSPVTGEFLTQMASNAENVSIWRRHHAYQNWYIWNVCSALFEQCLLNVSIIATRNP